MTLEQQNAILSLCGYPQYHMEGKADLKVLEEAESREILPGFAAALWVCRDREKFPLATEIFMRAADKLPVSAWITVDQQIRSEVYDPDPGFQPSPPYRFPGLFKKAARRDEALSFPSQIIIALCHRSGWTRQKALSSLDDLPPVLATCLLLVRANDWVPSIRSAATELLPRFIMKLNAGEKLHVLPLAAHLRDCGRLDQPVLPEEWCRLLSQPLNEGAWLEVWSKAPPRGQRLYLSLLQPEVQMPGERIRHALLSSKNRMAIIFHLTRILPRLPQDEQETAARLVASSSSVPVVRAWLDYLILQRPDEAVTRLRGILASSSRSLRDFARFHLARMSPINFEKHYLKLLACDDQTEGALAGLAEVAPGAAHEEAFKRLNHPTPKIKKAAILALSQEWIEDNFQWLLSPTAWNSPSASHATRRRLRSIPRDLGSFVLRTTAGDILPAEVLKFLILQAPYFRKWDGLEYLLRMDQHGSLREEVLSALSIWYKTGRGIYLHLNEDRKRDLLELASKTTFPDPIRNEVRFRLEKAE